MSYVKRFCKIIAIALAATAMIAAITLNGIKLCFDGGARYIFFVGHTSSDCREVTAFGDARITRLFLRDVCGECAEYDRLDIDGYLEKVNGEILFVEELDDSVNYYCAAQMPYSLQLYGKTVNLHICVKKDGVKLGSPIIFGGY